MSDSTESDATKISAKTRIWKLFPVNLFMGFLVVGVLVALLLPNVSRSRPAARRSQCKYNLKQIGLALRGYHDAYGCFPPAYVADASGRPMHSWRVLILPYIDKSFLGNEAQSFHERYRFDEAWDGPNNRHLESNNEFRIFQCPSDSNNQASKSMTNYLAVIGPSAAWIGSEPTKVDDFPDGKSTTLHVVEVANSGIHWMEPRDLHFGQMTPSINSKAGQGISSAHGPVDGPGKGPQNGPGAFVLFVNGEVRYLSEAEMTSERLRALSTRNGGEEVDESR